MILLLCSALVLVDFGGKTPSTRVSITAWAKSNSGFPKTKWKPDLPAGNNQEFPIREEPLWTKVVDRWNGMVSLFQQYPSLLIGVTIRIGIAIALEFVLDGFLKGVVTPAITATGVGAVAAPLTFLVGQALQPLVHSIAFIVFDDNFLDQALTATRIKENLIVKRGKEWHRITLLEGMMTRYLMKSLAGWCIGWAGLCTMVPVLGHILTAFLTGWVVAWDYVYVPLSGMGYIGPVQQFQTVWHHRKEFHRFGFWAVLIEEIPFLGPACHVYNIYSAAFFLERLYSPSAWNDDATVSTVDSDSSWKEL